MLSRLLWGARISLLIAIAATLLGAAVGSLIGLLSGYYRGPLDGAVTKLIDVQLAFPFVLFAISVITVAGPGIVVLVVVLAIGSWVGHARIVRGLVLSLREREYVQAARALGAAGPRIVGRHLLPNVLSVIVIIATFGRQPARPALPRADGAGALHAGHRQAPGSSTPRPLRSSTRRSRGWSCSRRSSSTAPPAESASSRGPTTA